MGSEPTEDGRPGRPQRRAEGGHHLLPAGCAPRRVCLRGQTPERRQEEDGGHRGPLPPRLPLGSPALQQTLEGKRAPWLQPPWTTAAKPGPPPRALRIAPLPLPAHSPEHANLRSSTGHLLPLVAAEPQPAGADPPASGPLTVTYLPLREVLPASSPGLPGPRAHQGHQGQAPPARRPGPWAARARLAPGVQPGAASLELTVRAGTDASWECRVSTSLAALVCPHGQAPDRPPWPPRAQRSRQPDPSAAQPGCLASPSRRAVPVPAPAALATCLHPRRAQGSRHSHSDRAWCKSPGTRGPRRDVEAEVGPCACRLPGSCPSRPAAPARAPPLGPFPLLAPRGALASRVPGRPRDPDPEAPLGAWGGGCAPAPLLGPLSSGSRNLGLGGRGQGSTAAAGSIQADSGSVLPATSNFLDKGCCGGAGGEQARRRTPRGTVWASLPETARGRPHPKWGHRGPEGGAVSKSQVGPSLGRGQEEPGPQGREPGPSGRRKLSGKPGPGRASVSRPAGPPANGAAHEGPSIALGLGPPFPDRWGGRVVGGLPWSPRPGGGPTPEACPSRARPKPSLVPRPPAGPPGPEPAAPTLQPPSALHLSCTGSATRHPSSGSSTRDPNCGLCGARWS
ncbi:basic proline-rich protein-like [Tupaia chinensis]|uniref:basic proline-rich protein-like n=1 Tax=Tupaia chinensis TaxID=246437 RepID=UPI000703CDEA|nr:basic proline-rich protein-like [Tupaia chinensis]